MTVAVFDELLQRAHAAPAHEVLLTVSGHIPATIATDIAQQLRPRADFLELVGRLKADVLDYTKARAIAGSVGRGLEKLAGPNLMLAYACWLVRGRYRAIVTDGEQVGLPLASFLKASPDERPRHIMITHVISASKKVLLIDALRLVSHIDTFIVYSQWQQDFIRSRWKIAPDRIALIPFMVDEDFFDPAKVKRQPASRPRICSVGLERRDYSTLLRAVEGLDVDVVVAAASPWSKQRENVTGQHLPSNVTVRKFSQFELRQLYADCEFMVMPLQAVEFQAGVTAILEAMAMGKAVICSKAPGQTDVVTQGLNGCYVPVGDPDALRSEISRLLAERDDAARLGANARTMVVRDLGLNRYTERLFTIVQSTLSQQRA